jgi:hypothetical protein
VDLNPDSVGSHADYFALFDSVISHFKAHFSEIHNFDKISGFFILFRDTKYERYNVF